MDQFTKTLRSEIMSKVKQKDTAPELKVRKTLHRMGFRYILHDIRLPCKPDIVLPKYRCIIFVHGCFWHGHSCPRGAIPKTRAKFWSDKISNNKTRDRKGIKALKSLGYKVLVIWECEVKDMENLTAKLLHFICDKNRETDCG